MMFIIFSYNLNHNKTMCAARPYTLLWKTTNKTVGTKLSNEKVIVNFSNTFNKTISTAPVNLLSSHIFFQWSISNSKACSVLKHFLRKTWSLQINQDFDLGTLVWNNYLLLPPKIINRLRLVLKQEWFFEIYLKLLTRYDMKVYFSQ